MKHSRKKKIGRKAARPRRRDGIKRVMPSVSNRRQAVLVLGMHRSGTSALTRVLSLLGAALPSNLLGANEGNKAGHWESIDLIAIHDEILSSAGSRWDDWRAFNPDWNASQIAVPFKQKLLEAIERNWAASPLFVVKDPRICRFAPVWFDLLERIGAQPHVVIPIRNPLEVAASLKARNGFLPAKSYLLWLRHVLDAERDTRTLPRAFTTYDGLLKDWRGTVGQVARKAELRWPRHSDFAELEIDKFLATALRHHSVDAESLGARAEIVDWVRDVHDILQGMAGGDDGRSQWTRLDRVREDFDKATRAFGLVLAESEGVVSAARKHASEREQEAANLKAEAQAQRESLEKLKGELSGVQVRSAEQEKLAAERLIAFEEGKKRAAALTQEIEAARKDIAAAAAARDAANDGLAESRREAESLRDEVNSVRTWLREAQAQVQSLAGEGEHWRVQLEEREQQVAEQERLAAERLTALEEEQKRSALLTQEIEAMRANLRDARAYIEPLVRAVETGMQDIRRLSVERLEAFDKLGGVAAERDLAQKELEQIERENADLRNERETMKALLREVQSRSQSLASDLDAAQTKVRQEQAAHQRARDEIKQFAGVKDRLSAAEASLASEKKTSHRQNEELIRLQSLLIEAESGIAVSQSRSQSLASDLDAARTKVRQEQAAHQRARDEIKQFAGVKDRLSAAEASLASEKKTSHRQNDELVRLQSMLIEAESSVAARDKKLAAEAERAADEMRLLRAQAEELRATIARQASAIEEKVEQHRSSFSLLRGLRNRFSRRHRPQLDARAWEVEPIRRSKLFSPLLYLEHNPDVAARGDDPLEHYLAHGGMERRNPHPLFDAHWYVAQYPQAAEAKMTPLTHYITVGVSEGLDPMPLFDTDFYLRQNPEIAISGVNPLYHYMAQGAYEGRDPHLLFDSSWYLEQNPNVAAAKENPLLHYVTRGWKEGRDPHPDFDVKWYLNQYEDVAAAGQNPLEHYVLHGQKEGRTVKKN